MQVTNLGRSRTWVAEQYLLPGKIKINITWKIVTFETCSLGRTISKLIVTNTHQKALQICGHYRNMKMLFTSGGNWYSAIIGQKAVSLMFAMTIIARKAVTTCNW